MDFKIFLWSFFQAMDDKGERGKCKNSNILRIKKSSSDEIRSIFHKFVRAIIWWIKKAYYFSVVIQNLSRKVHVMFREKIFSITFPPTVTIDSSRKKAVIPSNYGRASITSLKTNLIFLFFRLWYHGISLFET